MLVIQAASTTVRSGVIAASKPNSALRLVSMLAGSLMFFGILASAAVAVLYILHDQRSSPAGGVAGAAVEPTQSDLNLPPGLVPWHRVADAGEFQTLIGFAPFVPKDLPVTTQGDASLAVSFPDDAGHRTGRVGFSSKDAAVDGITGPTIVLMEAAGAPGDTVDGGLSRITTGAGRALAATFPCGGLVIDLQFYFGPAPQEGEAFLTPYMTGVAQKFLDSAKGQCSGG